MALLYCRRGRRRVLMVARRRLEQLLRFYFAYLPPVYLAYLSQTTGSLESCAPQTVPLSLMHNRLLRRQDRSAATGRRKEKSERKKLQNARRSVPEDLVVHGFFVFGGRGVE